GLRDEVDFEGQAAMELEALCQPKYKENYKYQIINESTGWVVDSGEMFNQIIFDLERRASLNKISTQFHNTIADIIFSQCVKIRETFHINYVVLSGGVFQNSFLLAQTIKRLKEENFKVMIHKKLPPNDACISLGQAIVADMKVNSGKKYS
ncbi:MAG: carbamoyltransferase HypF, partial [Atribacterota bacterium]